MTAVADHIERNGRVTSNKARNRAAKFRERMQAEGFTQVNAWVRKEHEAEALEILRALRLAPATAVASLKLRDSETGQFISIRDLLEHED